MIKKKNISSDWKSLVNERGQRRMAHVDWKAIVGHITNPYNGNI